MQSATNLRMNEMLLTTKNNICQVCGDHAIIANYGAITCLPCRTFFGRNALCSKKLRPCRNGNHCKIDLTTRKFCPSCRLGKCFTVGMTRDLIRKQNLVKTKRKLNIQESDKCDTVRIPQEAALDRPAVNTYYHLNDADRIRISNVVHAFDTFNPLPKVLSIVESVKKSPLNLLCNLSQTMEAILSGYHFLQCFLSATPDFKVLTSAEQVSLFQRNMLGVLCATATCLVHEFGIFDKTENELIFSLVHGKEVTEKSKTIISKYSYDPVSMKLLIISLAFSSNCYMINNHIRIDQDSLLLGTFRLFGSQNFYVEILWKYLVQTYGFEYAVKIYSKMIKQLLDGFSLSINAYRNNIIHKIYLDYLMKQIETLSFADRDTEIPLWGKRT